MDHQTANELRRRVDALERRLRVSYLLLAAAVFLLAVASASTWSGSAQSSSAASILRARGLVIEDARGRERILLGAPVPQVAGRKRQDPATGLVFLGENGADRIMLGDEPDPMVRGKVFPRRVPGVGMLIHDPDGTERGGYGVLDDGSAVLTLDWGGAGEGFSALVNDRQGFAGAAVWHRSPLGVYREGVTMGVLDKDKEAFLKLTDGTGTQRARLQQQGASDAQLLLYDSKGQLLGERLKR